MPKKCILACIALHNYLRQTNNASDTPSGYVDSDNSDGTIILGSWRNEVDERSSLRQINPVRGSRPRANAIEIRQALKDYLCSNEGSVEWQLDYVRRTAH